MPYILALDQGTSSSRALLVDAEGRVALASEWGRDEVWAKGQVEEYTRLAAGYLPPIC